MSLQQVLETMTYKPTYSFEIVDINGSDVLRITMSTHDSRPDEAPPLSIPVDFPVPEWLPENAADIEWRNWLHLKIYWCELHESDEWLRFDGELYRDPHKESMIR